MSARNLKLLGTTIEPGSSHRLNFNSARLYSATAVEVPVIIERSKKDGPVVLLTAGLHGDEINGVEIVRQFIARGFNKPAAGTIICIPVLNIFGFLDLSREFPDGRDLNRSFPGYKNGSLAGRFAYQIMNEIVPAVDYILDFHTGGAHRFNAPQVRVDLLDTASMEIARVFKAPFIISSNASSKTFRGATTKLGKKYVLFEGGKSLQTDKKIIKSGLDGALRVLAHLEMITSPDDFIDKEITPIEISKTTWLRAKYSGLFHPKIACGKLVEKGEFIATITDPYGSMRYKVKASQAGYIININENPIVYQGDAVFHIALHG